MVSLSIMKLTAKCFSVLVFFLIPGIAITQPVPGKESIDSSYKIIIAGKQYDRKQSYQKLWGTHYRKEWATPVKIKIVNLDTLAGGLTPYQSGGGRQTKTLRLRDAQGREYVLRSIDKSFGKALPEIYQGTIIETTIDDQVSIAHPYAAIAIPPMAKAAKIYHTNPEIIFIPEQPAHNTYNKEFDNDVYLIDKRADEN